MRGITSTVYIMWLVDDSLLETTVRNISSTLDGMQIYMDSYTINQLSITDNENVYQCKVLIDTKPLVNDSDTFILNVTGK